MNGKDLGERVGCDLLTKSMQRRSGNVARMSSEDRGWLGFSEQATSTWSGVDNCFGASAMEWCGSDRKRGYYGVVELLWDKFHGCGEGIVGGWWLAAGTTVNPGVGPGGVSQQFLRCLKQPYAGGLMPKGLTLPVWPTTIHNQLQLKRPAASAL